VRMGDTSRAGCVVVISHGNQKARTSPEPQRSIRMKVAEGHVGTKYVGLFEPHKQVEITANGKGTFTCRPGSLEVWVPHKPASR